VYVPSKDVERGFKIRNEEGSESAIKVDDKKFTTLLVGGDQLTVTRIRGAQMIRGDSEMSKQRFEGLLPVVEDWHAKMCFLEVTIMIYTLITSMAKR
jgi:L1 cell adhesion molecule like protein